MDNQAKYEKLYNKFEEYGLNGQCISIVYPCEAV